MAADILFEAKRTGLARVLFAILQPRRARAVSVNAEAVRLLFGSRSTDISLGDVETVDVAVGWLHSGVRIRHSACNSHVSGLPRTAAFAWPMCSSPQDVSGGAVSLRRNLRGSSSCMNGWRHWPIRPSTSPPTRFANLRPRRKLSPTNSQRSGRERCRMLPRSACCGTSAGFWMRPARPGRRPTRRSSPTSWPAPENSSTRSSPTRSRKSSAGRSSSTRQRNLVVAAAGSGKTSVIVAKTGWLVRKGYRTPSELLLLAFARDARREMEERMAKRLDAAIARDVTVRTFHGLGMAIIGEAEGKRPALAATAENDRALFDLLKGIVADLLADRELSTTLHEWFQAGFAPYRSEHEFRNWSEYHDYIRKFDIRSLKGETVRSFEECEIANFLYLNGIAYKYEAPYEHDLATSEKRQYKPDFHLPEHGIYIEHFGIDAKGNTAKFVDQGQYLRDMEWKRAVHAEHGTVLVETFSHEQADGRLLRNLTEKLADHGVTLSPIPREDVFAALEKQGRIDPFTRLVATFLQHFKGSRLSLAEITKRAAAHRDSERAQAFLAVFQPIFERYQEALAGSGEIDFHDMINRATDLVEAGRYRSPFGYILVDEFQDISPSRARLLKALLDSSPGSQLFAVGDDWQAIYRFGGSDIAVMREFGDHFGAFERIDLETTFRCADRIAAVATDFVLRNPAQIRKTVRTTRKADRPAVYVGLPSQDLSLLKEALDRIAEDARRHEGTSEVLLLGRYRHLRPPQPAGSVEAVSGTSLHLDDRAPLEGSGGRLCGGPRSVFGKVRVSRRDSRRSAARSGAGGARSPSERRGAAPALRCRHPGETAGLPACRRRPAVGIRDGVDRWRIRSRPYSAVRRRPTYPVRDAPVDGWCAARTPRRERLLRLFELSALRAHRTLPALAAERACPSSPAAPTAAATAAGPSMPVRSARAG